jgi:hypothetical protein
MSTLGQNRGIATMVKSILAVMTLTSLVTFSPAALATTYNYNMLYDGTTVALEPGSDVPAGSVFFAGDSFNLNVHAAGTDFWHVNSNFNVFVPLSFLVDEFAARTADISTNFLNNGVLAYNITDTAVDQSFIHIGSQFWSFAAGLDFDEIAVSWTLLAINTGGPSTIHDDAGFFNGFGQNDAPFVKSNKITYGGVSAVPVPAAFPLFMTALAGAAAASRRRKSKPA